MHDLLLIEGHITPQDKAACDYYYVPFDVPANVERVDVRYTYSHPRHHGDLSGVGNTIDIGLFDPRGHEFLRGAGFRGWSGSDRQHIFVGEFETAPGYIQGLIQAGRWHVILGLYRVADEGCDYRITIDFTAVVSRQSSVVSRQLPVATHQLPVANRQPPHWYRGDLQSHTHHSDGKGSLATLIATARARGLDFLAVTDHNTITHNLEFDSHRTDDLLLIPAEEVTTYYGHMNVWGVGDWVDFRARTAADMQRIVASAHARGYLTSVNHPKPDGPPWEYGDAVEFDCIEVWQAPWPFHNTVAYQWWDSLLQAGRRVIAVGGSDYHQPVEVMQGNPHLLGQPTTWMLAEQLSSDAILDAIRRGHVFISADVDGPQLIVTGTSEAGTHLTGDVLARADSLEVTCTVRSAAGQTLRVIADGAIVREVQIETEDWTHKVAVNDAKRYVRAEVSEHVQMFGHEQLVMSALSNPFFVRNK